MFDDLIATGYQVDYRSHARAILQVDFPEAAGELEAALAQVRIPIEEIVSGGGGEAKVTQRLRRALAGLGWSKFTFTVEHFINGQRRVSQSHEIDHVREFDGPARIALEIEWNNKDPFYDRDLENFKRLHAEGAISIGIIVTRGRSLQDDLPEMVSHFVTQRQIRSVEDLVRFRYKPTDRQKSIIGARLAQSHQTVPFADAFAHAFVQDKFGQATTHWRKLQDRVHRGVGNPCPLVLIGLPKGVVTFDCP